MEGLIEKYGPIVVCSLIDQKGIEVPIGESFETHMHLLNNSNLKYAPYDHLLSYLPIQVHRVRFSRKVQE